MMNGYDKAEALTYILSRVRVRDHEELKDMIPQLISQAIDADMKFMHENGVIDTEGNAGDSYYDDDDAFEFMVDELTAQNGLNPEMSIRLASLIDDYMDYQQEYLESKGLVDWD